MLIANFFYLTILAVQLKVEFSHLPIGHIFQGLQILQQTALEKLEAKKR